MKKLLLSLIAGAMISGCGSMATDKYASDSVDQQLYLAIYYIDEPAVARFLDKGGNPNAEGLNGRPMLTFAVEQKNFKIIELLLGKGARASSLGALSSAVHADQVEVAEILLAKGANLTDNAYRGSTVLHLAKSPKMVEILLDKGANINSLDDDGESPLLRRLIELMPYENGYWYGSDYAQSESVKAMVAHGASLSARSKEGATPLHYAVKGLLKLDALQFLITKGADVNARDREGKTPLHWALETNHGDAAMVLLNNGANARIADNRGRTPLHWAEQNYMTSELKAALVNNGADANARDSQGRTAQENREYLLRQAEEKNKAEAAERAAYDQRKADTIKKMVEYNNAREEMAAQSRREAEAKQPSVWERNAESSRKALKEMQERHSNTTNPNYGTSCNSSVYGCR